MPTLPPAVLSMLEAPKEGENLPLESLIVAGDVCSIELVGRWSSGRRMVNAYGPTETTVCATTSEALSESEGVFDGETDHEHAGLCAGRQYATHARGSSGRVIYRGVGIGARIFE